MNKPRCEWVTTDPDYIRYHDEEWGPIPDQGLTKIDHDDRYLFEMLSLEGAQAGLSWLTILKRRESYREAFDQFQPEIVAQYDEAKIQALLNHEGIIRHEGKIRSVVSNAKAFLKVQEEFGSFNDYVWHFVQGKQIINYWKTIDDVPAQTKESEALSKDLKKRGFKFVGPVICYSFMQAVGLVHDHTTSCFLHKENRYSFS